MGEGARKTWGLCAALLLCALAAMPALGDTQTASEPASEPTLLERLGTPADLKTVRAALRTALTEEDPAAALELAQALGYAGGHAAVEALSKLLRVGDEDVRIAALEAVEQIGLRSHAACTRVREIVRDRRGREQLAAVRALGVVGSGRDLELLLRTAEGEDRKLCRASFQALRMLTSSRIPYDHARWARHGKVLKRRVVEILDPGLASLDESPEGAEAELLASELMRYAWLDLELVEDYLRDWATSVSQARRQLACRFTADLRLSDYGRTVRNIRKVAIAEELKAEADRAMRALGVEPIER